MPATMSVPPSPADAGIFVAAKLQEIRKALDGLPPLGVDDLKDIRRLLSDPAFQDLIGLAALWNDKSDLIREAVDLGYVLGDKAAALKERWERTKEVRLVGGLGLTFVGIAAMFAATAPPIAILALVPVLIGVRVGFSSFGTMTQLDAERHVDEDLRRLVERITERLTEVH